MGEQRNLTEENVDELRKHLEEMKKDNQDLEYRFWPQKEMERIDRQEEILDRLEAIEMKLDLIFDGHILIDGSFKKIRV